VKKAKEKLTVWVEPEVANALRALAGSHRLSMSETAARYLRVAVQEKAEHAGVELVVPALEAAIDRASRRTADRLANLLARTALESAASRRMVFQVLVEEFGVDGAKEISGSSWNSSVDSLKKPSEGVRELLKVTEYADPNGG
jgi:hypothetical protein